jgi:GNAT superfamily N-acetyltransferase
MLKIERVAEFSPLREAIYRLRYDAYTDFWEANQEWLDHGNHIIRDDLDETGHLYAAFSDGELIGTVRSNYVGESDLTDYFERVGIDPSEFANASATFRLAVAPKHRGTTTAIRLAIATFVDGLRDGIQSNIIDTRPVLVPFYEKLGYEVHGHFVDPQYGPCALMVLDIHDEVHLRRVGSPFLKHYLAWAARVRVAG